MLEWVLVVIAAVKGAILEIVAQIISPPVGTATRMAKTMMNDLKAYLPSYETVLHYLKPWIVTSIAYFALVFIFRIING